MKKLFTLFTSIGLAFSLSAQLQIPNSSFENWTTTGTPPYSRPDNWATWETSLATPLGLATKDTVVRILGTASIKIKTDSVQAGPTKRLINGFAYFGSTIYSGTGGITFVEAPFAGKPDTLFFAYRYAPSGTDSAFLILSASGPAAVPFNGGIKLGSTSGTWALVSIPVVGQMPATVDSLSIYFSSSASAATAVAGSVLNVDAIRIGYRPSVGIEDFVEKIDLAVFPNPTADFLNVNFNNVSSPLYFEMVDALGRIVVAKELTSEASKVDVSKVEEGAYFYRISTQGVVVKSDGLVISR